MSDIVAFGLTTEVFVTLFVIMDPVGTIPIFLSLTRGRSARTKRRAAWQAVAVSFGVISAFAFFGQGILGYLHISLVPLGTPLLAGPGAIVATMVFSERVEGWSTFAAVALGVLLVHVTIWTAMRFSLPILRVLRDGGVMLVSRIAGLLLSAIAVQLVADAIRAFIAGEG